MPSWYDPYLLLGDPVVVTDSSHRIIAVNAAYEEASGYRREEIVGKDAGHHKSGLTPAAVYDSLKRTLARKQVWRGILTNRRPDGRLWNSSLTITPLERPDGVYYLGVCRDIQDITSHNVVESYEELFSLIARVAEAADPSVEIHLHQVERVTKWIAHGTGHSPQDARWIGLASVLHDVGKMFIPREILFKPGKLTVSERELIKTHTTLGAEFLDSLHDSMAKIYGYNEALVVAREVAHSHHERYDGAGYPEGLRGEEIPLSARMVALADTVDALLSVRPYKPAWGSDQVVEYLKRERGGQFDPELVDLLLAHWDQVSALYRRDGSGPAKGEFA